MKRLSIFFFTVFTILIGAVSAQNTYTITGSVADSLNHEKIFYATLGLVVPDSTGRVIGTSFSDNKGNFVFTGISEGRYILKASLVGYDMVSVPVSISGNSKTVNLGEILMKKVSMTLQDVKIKGEKPVYMQDGEKTMYNVSEDPTIQSGNASDALQNAPGVEVDIEGNITLRGVSSVEIWINDKPSRMNEEGLKTFIQQLPANSIERIEVITNPSAKYSAKGAGGIINVITTGKIKKNSFISFGVRGSSKPHVSPWVSYVYSNEKVSMNFYLHGNYYRWKSNNDSYRTTLNDDRDTSSLASSHSDSKSNSFSCGLYFNGSYTPDTLNTLGWWLGFNPGWSLSDGNEFESRMELLDNAGLYEYTSESDSRSNNLGGYTGIWYDHRFKNDERHRIETSINFNSWNLKWLSNSMRDYFTQDYMDYTRKSTSKSRSTSVGASIDYTVPYHKNGTIELGVSGDYGYDYNLSREDTLDRLDELFLLDTLRLYDAKEQNGSFETYVTLEHKFGNFTIKGGLRAEYTDMDLEIFNSEQDNAHKSYFSLFPSLHLSYRTKNMHNFKLSYTRRVSNPSVSQLTTFVSYSIDSYSMGNPELTPTFTNSVEAGWTKYINKFGNVGISAYYRDSRDEISSLSDVAYSDIFNRIVTFSQPMNAGHSYRVGADLSATYRLKSFMNIRFYANLYYYHSEFLFRNFEEPQIAQKFNYSFRLNFWAKLWKVLEVNASANYRSPSVSLFTTSKPGYSIDCGLRADLCKRKISVHLNVNDIFNWNKSISTNNNPYYISTSTTKYNSRSINAGITFRFGKMELESQAKEGGGSDQQ